MQRSLHFPQFSSILFSGEETLFGRFPALSRQHGYRSLTTIVYVIITRRAGMSSGTTYKHGPEVLRNT